MATASTTSSHTDVLLEDIKLHLNTEMFQRHLEKCSRRTVESWKDSDSMDLLHHAILENNFVVVGTLFAHGYFKPPHEVGISKTDGTRVPLEDKDKESPMLPLDLAARFGHLRCVKTILDFYIYSQRGPPTNIQRSSKDNYFNMSCKLDSPMALRLPLSEASDNEEDARTALDISLKTAKPECVDALLRYGIDTKRLFGGMNLFHVLFAYSKSFEETWFESFVTVTSVLLRHGHDVNACRPSRTYPLYSLLRCTRVSSIETSAPYILASLLLLLQAGANSNLDEVFVEEAVRDNEYSTAFGRQPYASALHCVIDAAINYAEEVSDGSNVIKYVYKCCELLLRHGADPSYVGKYTDAGHTERSGNVLHALADAGSRMGRQDRALLLLLLRHGADPDQCSDGRYPLTAYCDVVSDVKFVGQGSEVLHENRTHHEERTQTSSVRSPQRRNTLVTDATDSDFVTDVRRMCRMIGFMSRNAQIACEKIMRSKLYRVRSSPSRPCTVTTSQSSSSSQDTPLSEVARQALDVIMKELEAYTHSVDSLKRCCSMIVWKSCRRHVGNVYKLPAPMPLINVLLDQL